MPRAEFRRTVEGRRETRSCTRFSRKGDCCTRTTRPSPISSRRCTSWASAISELALFRAATIVLPSLYKAHKWMLTRGDVNYTALWLLYTATSLAQIEVISAGQLIDREVIPQALKLNPPLLTTVYTELLNTKKTVKSVQAALDAVDAYMAERARVLFAPVFEHLAGRARAAVVHGDRGVLHEDVRHRARHDGVRVPRGSGDDRQGVDRHTPHEAEPRRRAGAGVFLARRRRTLGRRGRRQWTRRASTVIGRCVFHSPVRCSTSRRMSPGDVG